MIFSPGNIAPDNFRAGPEPEAGTGSRNRKPEAGTGSRNRKPEAGSRKPESRKLEAGSRKPEPEIFIAFMYCAFLLAVFARVIFKIPICQNQVSQILMKPSLSILIFQPGLGFLTPRAILEDRF